MCCCWPMRYSDALAEGSGSSPRPQEGQDIRRLGTDVGSSLAMLPRNTGILTSRCRDEHIPTATGIL